MRSFPGKNTEYVVVWLNVGSMLGKITSWDLLIYITVLHTKEKKVLRKQIPETYANMLIPDTLIRTYTYIPAELGPSQERVIPTDD